MNEQQPKNNPNKLTSIGTLGISALAIAAALHGDALEPTPQVTQPVETVANYAPTIDNPADLILNSPGVYSSQEEATKDFESRGPADIPHIEQPVVNLPPREPSTTHINQIYENPNAVKVDGRLVN